MVEPDRSHMHVWPMRIACCITKAIKHTLKIGNIIAFPINNLYMKAPHCYILVHYLSCCVQTH